MSQFLIKDAQHPSFRLTVDPRLELLAADLAGELANARFLIHLD